MSDPVAATQVLEDLMAGIAADEIETRLHALSSTERQTVLCTACYLLDEVKANCIERGDEIVKTLRKNCPLYRSKNNRCDFRVDSGRPGR